MAIQGWEMDVCRLRLEGKSIYDIKNTLGISHETCRKCLRVLAEKEPVKPFLELLEYRNRLSMEQCLEICERRLIPQSVEYIAQKMGLDYWTVEYMLEWMQAKKPVAVTKCIYVNVQDWLNENYWTIRDLSNACGYSYDIFRKYVTAGIDETPKREKLAVAISQVTGIPADLVLKERGD